MLRSLRGLEERKRETLASRSLGAFGRGMKSKELREGHSELQTWEMVEGRQEDVKKRQAAL